MPLAADRLRHPREHLHPRRDHRDRHEEPRPDRAGPGLHRAAAGAVAGAIAGGGEEDRGRRGEEEAAQPHAPASPAHCWPPAAATPSTVERHQLHRSSCKISADVRRSVCDVSYVPRTNTNCSKFRRDFRIGFLQMFTDLLKEMLNEAAIPRNLEMLTICARRSEFSDIETK